MNKVLLIGGPGNISASTITKLLEKGHEVGIYTTSERLNPNLNKKIKLYRGNRNEEENLEAAVRAFQPDIVIDFVCFLPKQAEYAANLLNGRISQYIFISTVDVYGFPLSHLPMRETDCRRPSIGEYASNKAACEEILLGHAGKSSLPLTIVRPAYSFGPNFVIGFFSHDGGRYMISRLRKGKPILVPGGGNTLIHVSSAYNTGQMIAMIAGHQPSIGKSYTCGHPVPITHDEYVELFAKAVGAEPNLVHIPFEILLDLKIPEIDNGILLTLSRHNLFFSVEEFRKDFPDFKWELSLEAAARHYVEQNDRDGNFAGTEDGNFEDRVINAWLERIKHFRM